MAKTGEVRLRHMLDAARETLAFSRGRTREELQENRLLTPGLLKCLTEDLPPLAEELERVLA